jgi:microcystin-dependent protein
MADPFVAEIRIMTFDFAPTGWATCDGQLLPISQNTALFSLLGTHFGGDGKSTFALPDLDASCAIGAGQGPGLSERLLGEQAGTQNVTLLNAEMPTHNHMFQVQAAAGDQSLPTGNAVARAVGATPFIPAGAMGVMAPQCIGMSGGSLPHNNMQPFLTLNFCIAMQGVFPPRPS